MPQHLHDKKEYDEYGIHLIKSKSMKTLKSCSFHYKHGRRDLTQVKQWSKVVGVGGEQVWCLLESGTKQGQAAMDSICVVPKICRRSTEGGCGDHPQQGTHVGFLVPISAKQNNKLPGSKEKR